jgi:hypothetical protein
MELLVTCHASHVFFSRFANINYYRFPLSLNVDACEPHQDCLLGTTQVHLIIRLFAPESPVIGVSIPTVYAYTEKPGPWRPWALCQTLSAPAVVQQQHWQRFTARHGAATQCVGSAAAGVLGVINTIHSTPFSSMVQGTGSTSRPGTALRPQITAEEATARAPYASTHRSCWLATAWRCCALRCTSR